MTDYSRLSLFTSNHAQHDSEWTLQGTRSDVILCIPCALEMIEDTEILVVRKKFVLGEMLQIISGDSGLLVEMLADNQRLAWHIVETLHELLEIYKEDGTVTDVTIEILVQLCCLLELDELVCCLLHQIALQVEKSPSMQHSLPSLTLLGRLLNNIPALADVLLQTEGPLMSTLITCLGASEEKSKTASVYALLKVLNTATQPISLHRYGQMASKILMLLTGAQSQGLKQNAVELLRKLLENDEVTRGLMQQGNRLSLPSALKKMLMSRDVSLQVSSMQCVRQILDQDKHEQDVTHYAEDLLNADIAEFLFEALATTDGALLSCTFGCLLLFTECPSFFSKCHTVYGIESIVRAVHHCVKLNNTDALHQGLQVLSDILKRQPEDVHLLNGLGIHKQINSLLQTCLKHTDSTVQEQAGHALKHLLRKDHLPKPVDYGSIIDLLQSMQDCMERLPRPLSRTSSRRHRHKEMRQEEDEDVCSKEEKMLLGGLQVFQQAFSLTDILLRDPFSESHLAAMCQSDSNQTSKRNSLEGLQYFLLGVLDVTCIPIFMVNYGDLSSHGVFGSLFQMLHMAFKFNIDLDEFACKLVGSSFIQLSIGVKNKISSIDSESAVVNVVNLFLVELCVMLMDVSQTESKEVRGILEKGFPLIKGNCEDLLSILQAETPVKSYRTPASDCVDIKQQAVLALLYVAFLHSDRLVSEIELEDALDVFMSQYQNFKSFSAISTKHLLFLLAVCYCANNGSASHSKNVNRFHDYLSELDISSVYSHHPVMLHWCCTSAAFPYNLAKSMFQMWISHLQIDLGMGMVPESVNQDIKATLELLQMNTNCFSMLLDVVCSSNRNIIDKSTWLVKSSLNQSSPTESKAILDVLNNRLPGVMQRLCMTDENDTQDIHCVAILDLLCCVHQRCHIPDTEPTIAKLAYHVTNILSKDSTKDKSELIRVALNYLICLMVQTANHNDSRVALVILSSAGVLKMLERLVQIPEKQLMRNAKMTTLQGCALSLLALLVELQWKSKVKVQHTVKVALTSAIHMLVKSTTTLIRVCSTQLWSALLSASFQSPVVRLTDDSRDMRELLEDADVGLEIRSCHLRMLLIIVQNNILKGDELLCQASVHCFQSLIDYTSQKNKHLAKHLLNQPWNQLLLSRCLDLKSNEGMLAELLKLINVFLQCADSSTVVNQALIDAILEGIVKHKETLQRNTVGQYIQLVSQVIDPGTFKLKPRLRERIASQMKMYAEQSFDLAEEEAGPKILCMRGIFVSIPSSGLLTEQDLKTKASKICSHIGQLAA